MSEATEILDRVLRLYRNAETYTDTGQMEARGFIGRSRGTFATAFGRPGSLTFSFDGESGAGVIIQCRLRSEDGKTTHSCFGEEEDLEALSIGVAGASGATDGAAHVIPALLFPEETVGGWPVVDLRETRLMDRRTVGDVECFVIQGLHPTADPKMTVTLSVGVHDSLLYCVEESYFMDGIEEWVRLTYAPSGGV